MVRIMSVIHHSIYFYKGFTIFFDLRSSSRTWLQLGGTESSKHDMLWIMTRQGFLLSLVG